MVSIPLYKIVCDPFQTSLNKLADQSLPIKTMYKLKGVISMLREEYRKFDETRNEIAKKYADKTPEGVPIVEPGSKSKGVFKISSENMFLFAADLGELSKVQVEVPTLSVPELGPNVVLNTNDLILLEFITEE